MLKIDVTDCNTLIELLFALIKSILKVADVKVLEYIVFRLGAQPDIDSDCMDAIMDIDEASAALEKCEEQQLRGTRKALKVQQIELQAFHDEYRELVIELKGKGKPKTKKSKTQRLSLPKYWPEALQKDVKKFAPPDCLVWQSRASQSWNCQVKGWPHSNSRATRTRGTSESIHLLLSEAWYEWGILNGFPYDELLVDNLLPLEEILGAS